MVKINKNTVLSDEKTKRNAYITKTCIYSMNIYCNFLAKVSLA